MRKRSFDLLVLAAAHLLLFPVWIVLWIGIPLLIWLEDRGPIIYRQSRAGERGRVFIIFKFRTMVHDAEGRGPAWTVEGDERVTRIGRLLRRTALDELPQVWNVLKGDMSLVGPRPYPLAEQRLLEERIPGFDKRLLARPGLTSLAKVKDPVENPHATLLYDLEYIGRMSPWFDLELLLRSAWKALLGRCDGRLGKDVHRVLVASPPKQEPAPAHTLTGRDR